jgi:hypothetical protein
MILHPNVPEARKVDTKQTTSLLKISMKPGEQSDMVLGRYGKERSNMKFKMPKMPKIKMPDVMGKAKDLSKKVGASVKSGTKGAASSIKNLNPFRK